MKLGVIYFTSGGEQLAERLKKEEKISHDNIRLELKDGRNREPETESVREYIKRAFQEKTGLLFIGATGIAVRMIAPYVKDKLLDSPVIVADETGRFVISLLAGHVGGANELAKYVAALLHATPVITTATDGRDLFAVDVFAKKNHLWIADRGQIREISSRILRGECLSISILGMQEDASGDVGGLPPELLLRGFPPTEDVDILVADRDVLNQIKPVKAGILLEPREYVIGMGCRKNKDFSELEGFALAKCESLGVRREQVRALVSVDVKRDEPGLLRLAKEWGIPFLTFSAEELMQVKGKFESSDFVRRQVGTDNVCERAVMAYCGDEGELLLGKQAENGMTLAIGKIPWKLFC